MAAAKLGWFGWAFILSCSVVNYFLRFLRWQYYINKLGYSLPMGIHITYYMAGFALTATPAKAGETIRSLYLKSHGIKYSHSLAACFTERLLDVVVITIFAMFSLLVFEDYTRYVLITVIVFVLVLPGLRTRRFIHILTSCTQKLHQVFLKRLFSSTASLLDAAYNLLGIRVLYIGLSVGIVAWAIQGVAFYYVLSVLGYDISLYMAIAIYAISLLIGALSFVPGGIGTTELVMGLLLHTLGADVTIAVSAPLISRLSTLWFAVVLGILAMLRLGWIRRFGTAV